MKKFKVGDIVCYVGRSSHFCDTRMIGAFGRVVRGSVKMTDQVWVMWQDTSCTESRIKPPFKQGHFPENLEKVER